MNLNKLYQDILGSQWMLNYEHLLSLAPLIEKFVNPDSRSQLSALSTLATPEAAVSFITEKGKRLSLNDDLHEMPEGSIAVVDLIGAMVKYGGCCSEGTEAIAAQLAMALSLDNVIGAVLLGDSGGGAVNAVPPMLSVLGSRSKPVVSLWDSCGSAAYFAASSTDHIMASNTVSSAFGSIGVMFTLKDVRPKLEKEGYKIHELYADQSEHKNEAFNLMLEGKYDKIKKEMLNPLAQKFQDHVRARRGSVLKESVTGVLTGKMFWAEDAINVGLADSLGNFQMAMDKVRELAEDKAFMLRLALSAKTIV